MKPPKISIVLPTFNGSRYLGQAIESCLEQAYTDWELIIVDDASTDATPAVINEYLKLDQRIRVIRHSVNRKLPGALNTGFSQAYGAYFTWTSDDNVSEPQWLERMMTTLKSSPEHSIVYTDYCFIDEESQVTGDHCIVQEPCHLVVGNSIGPSFLYRKEVHQALGGFDENLFLVEDYDFWLRASIRFNILALHEVLYRYRIHGCSLTAQRQKEIALAHEVAILRSINQMTWVELRSRVIGVLKVSRLVRARGEGWRANRLIWKAIRMAPLSALLILGKMLLCGPDEIYRMPLKAVRVCKDDC